MLPIWIERPQEASFQEWLKAPQFSYWQLEGEGGIGKTSLLERFRDKAANAGKVAILMPADLCIAEAGQDGVNLLLNLDIENAPAFDKVKAVLTNARSTLKAVLQSAGEQVTSHWDALSELAQMEVGDEAGAIMKGVRDIAGVIKAIKGAGDSGQRDNILKSPEESLLKALAEDVKKGGVWLIDTWEKDTKDQISSRLAFPQPGRLRTPVKAEPHKITPQQWLDGVSSWLRAQGARCLFVVAGRMAPRELGGERPPVKGVQAKAKPLSAPEIRQFLEQGLPDLDHGTAPLPSLVDRTGGLPILMLWVVRLVENELREDPAWTWAKWPTLLPAFEQDERQGLIHYAIDRIVQHQTGITDIWKLALVDILNREILDILFPGHEEDLIDRLERSGVIDRLRHDPNTWTIHDTSRDALECFAEHKGLLDPSRNKDLHQQLGIYFDARAGWDDACHGLAYLWISQGSKNYISNWQPEGLVSGHQPWLRRAVQQWALFGVVQMRPINGKDERRNFVRRMMGLGIGSTASRRGLSGILRGLSQRQYEGFIDLFANLGDLDTGFDADDSWIDDRLASAADPEDLAGIDLNGILEKYRQSYAALRTLAYCTHVDIAIRKSCVDQMLILDKAGPTDLGAMALILWKAAGSADAVDNLLKRAIHADPQNAINLGTYAHFMEKVRADMDAADALYKRAIDADPKQANNLGNYALFMKNVRADMDAAEALYKRAIDVDPSDADWLGNYALLMQNVRADMDAAEALYKRAIDVDPEHANNLGNYALFIKNVRADMDAAEALYKRAIDADPKHARNLGNYALFMKNVRADMDAADALYKRAIDANPKDADWLGNYALFMKNVRADMDAAEALFKRAIEADPKNARNLGNYALFMKNVRADMDAAAALYKRAVGADLKDANALGNYACLLLSLNRAEEGRQVWEQAMAYVGGQETDLHLELWFYAYAHFPDRREEAAVEIERRLAAGDRSPGWDLSANVRAALPSHPEPDRLIRFAEAISGLAYRG